MSESHSDRLEELEEERPYLSAFYEGFPWQALPLYMTAMVVVIWLTVLTLWFAAEHAPSWNSAGFRAASLGLVVLLAATPIFFGAAHAVQRWVNR